MPSDKPTRGYDWLGYFGLFLMSLFITINIVVDGQYTLGEPDGVLIVAEERPLLYCE